MKTAIKTTLMNLLLAGILFFSGCKKGDTGEQGPQGPAGTSSSTVYYPTVSICDQHWMTKNLDVTTYSNGDPIPLVSDVVAWAALTTGAYCYYDNNSANGTIYGKLYNWYAVTDPRGLAPLGWHIPTDFEWTTLENCLGGAVIAGGALKETGTSHWNAPNTDATNITGFAALAGGYRHYDGNFDDTGIYGVWWSSTEGGATIAWNRWMSYDDGVVGQTNDHKESGFSVRCLRD